MIHRNLLAGILMTVGIGTCCATTNTVPAEGWRQAEGAAAKAELKITSAGLELPDGTGDTYERDSTFTSVFLRDPALRPPYAINATVERVKPQREFAQVGLVAWRDKDNYVRLMTGFDPPAFECLGEFDADAGSVGTFPMYPDKLDHPVHLRLEVLEHTVRGYASHNGERWLALGAFLLPDEATSAEFVKGIGVAAVGGEMAEPPIITSWSETAIKPVQLGKNLVASSQDALLAMGNSGWGSEQVKFLFENSTLKIRAFSGSDAFFGLEPYPFVGYELPRGDWQLNAKIRNFDPTQEGAFIKAGVVLWQNTRRFLNLGAVSDKQFNQMYFENVYSGKEERSRQWGWHTLTPSDLYLRVTRKGDTYNIAASYDNVNWQSAPDVEIELPEPQLRLMVSGDVFLQAPNSPPEAVFESVVLTPLPEAK